MANVNTMIKRGKELDRKNVVEDGIYAVRYALDATTARDASRQMEQWGLVRLNRQKQVTAMWNVDHARGNEWRTLDEPISLDVMMGHTMHLFRSTDMERQFVHAWEDAALNGRRLEKMIVKYHEKKDHLDMLRRNVIVRVIEWLM